VLGMTIHQNQTPMERVENKCRTNANGCWVWFGAVKSKQDPVPIFREFGHTLLIQRELYKWLHEIELPRNHAILITCGNKKCCNPEHLTTRTYSEMRAETRTKIKEKRNENQ